MPKNVQTTIVLISHVSKVMLKIVQARHQQYMNQELPGAQVGLRKTEESEMKLTTFVGSQKKQENPRETYIPASLTMLKPLTA